MTVRRAVLTTLLLFTASGAMADMPPPEPAGYRTADYRAPVPATVNGRPALTTEQAAALWRQGGAVFIDTLPQPPRPQGLPEDTVWHPRPRNDIPGSIWLPDTGYGELPAFMADYFEHNLQEAIGGDKNRPLKANLAAWKVTAMARRKGWTLASQITDKQYDEALAEILAIVVR